MIAMPTAPREVFSVFGYGSLVNLNTLQNTPLATCPAALFGWRRTWVPRPNMPSFPSALLSVKKDEGSHIKGMLIADELHNRPQLDEREKHYSAHNLDIDCLKPWDDLQSSADRLHGFDPAIIYQADPVAPSDQLMPILQSYLDAVLQGFLTLGGVNAVQEFCETTDGWQVGLHYDRQTPIYPRAQKLTPEEISVIDPIVEATIEAAS